MIDDRPFDTVVRRRGLAVGVTDGASVPSEPHGVGMTPMS